METPNYTTIFDLFDEVKKTLIRKNHDYDNAFSKACYLFGPMYAASKIYEKCSRIITLTHKNPEITNESLSDALIDIIGYAALYYERLNHVEQDDNGTSAT